jgi:protein O-mannosyl-transferase
VSARAARSARVATPVVALLAIAASITGIVNQFTYDDRYIIELNPLMKSLAGWWRTFGASYWPKDWGGDGYRPLTVLAFKIEYAIGHGSPVTFHAANVALYALACVLVYGLARRVFEPERQWAAWIAAALFAVHPVHVEAVAGVVGQSELIVGVALLSATLLYLRDRQRGALETSTAAWIALLYAAGCFAKEHAIVLPALLGAVELILLPDREPMRERIARLRPFYLVLALVAVAFVGVRSWVLADHSIGGFQPFTPFNTLRITNTDRMLTALGVVPEWVRLLYWPVRLSSEYGPPDVEIAQGFSVSQLPGLALLLAILAFGFILRRRQPVISFGIAFVCITLLPSSNFVLPAGIVLAERTLFLPSVGAMFIAATIVAVVAEHWTAARSEIVRRAAVVAVVVVLAAGVWRSATRSMVWRDNDRLFRQAVVDSPDAYRAHYMLGAWHFENKRKRDGEVEYRRALNLFPYDPFLSYNMAEQYRQVGLCGPALPLYRWTFGLDANFPLGRGNFAWCLVNEGLYDEARARAFETIRVGGDLQGMRRVIFITDSVRAAERGLIKRSPLAQLEAPSKLPETVQKTAVQASVPRGE